MRSAMNQTFKSANGETQPKCKEKENQLSKNKRAYVIKLQPEFSQLYQTVSDIRRGFMRYKKAREQNQINLKKLEKSNKSKYSRGQKTFHEKVNQLDPTLAKFESNAEDGYMYSRVVANQNNSTRKISQEEKKKRTAIIENVMQMGNMQDSPADEQDFTRSEVTLLFDQTNDALKNMTNNEFTKILANEYIRADVIKRLQAEPQLMKIPRSNLEFMMENCERDIFLKFRDNELTVDQLSQRVVERRFGLKYKTLDDLKPLLLPQFFDESVQARIPILNMIYGSNHQNINRELQPHEINFKCLKSINWKPKKKSLTPSHFFKTPIRSKSLNPHRHICTGQYANDKNTVQSVHDNHCKDYLILESMATQLKKKKDDQAKASAQGVTTEKEVALLKKQLDQQIWQHKMHERNALPHASSKPGFQDKYEMWFKDSFWIVKPDEDLSKIQFLKAKKQSQLNRKKQKQDKVPVQKKNVFDRGLMFLKRLKDEIPHFHLKKEIQEILRIHASDEADEMAEKEFHQAVEKDLSMRVDSTSKYHLDRAALLGPDPYDPNVRCTMSQKDRIRQYALYQSMTPAIGKQPLDQIRKNRLAQSFEGKAGLSKEIKVRHDIQFSQETTQEKGNKILQSIQETQKKQEDVSELIKEQTMSFKSEKFNITAKSRNNNQISSMHNDSFNQLLQPNSEDIKAVYTVKELELENQLQTGKDKKIRETFTPIGFPIKSLNLAPEVPIRNNLFNTVQTRKLSTISSIKQHELKRKSTVTAVFTGQTGASIKQSNSLLHNAIEQESPTNKSINYFERKETLGDIHKNSSLIQIQETTIQPEQKSKQEKHTKAVVLVSKSEARNKKKRGSTAVTRQIQLERNMILSSDQKQKGYAQSDLYRKSDLDEPFSFEQTRNTSLDNDLTNPLQMLGVNSKHIKAQLLKKIMDKQRPKGLSTHERLKTAILKHKAKREQYWGQKNENQGLELQFNAIKNLRGSAQIQKTGLGIFSVLSQVNRATEGQLIEEEGEKSRNTVFADSKLNFNTTKAESRLMSVEINNSMLQSIDPSNQKKNVNLTQIKNRTQPKTQLTEELLGLQDSQSVGVGDILIQSRTIEVLSQGDFERTAKFSSHRVECQELRKSLQNKKDFIQKLETLEYCTPNQIQQIEEKAKFAQKQVKDFKSCDYKTGAIMHRIANKDIDPRTQILLKRHKMMNRMKIDSQRSSTDLENQIYRVQTGKIA